MTAAQTTAVVFCALAAVGTLLRVVAATRLHFFLARRSAETGDAGPPLTFWRAVKPGVPALDAKLDALVAASRAGDQILLGADAGSNELAACEQLRARFPERDIVVVACQPDRTPNPKIAKFVQMTPHARHEHWLLTDSEALIDGEFTGNIRAEWLASGAEVLTAGYRFASSQRELEEESGEKALAGSLPEILDGLHALTTLWPGLMLSRRLDFTLGACTAVRAADVHTIGGWEILGAELAEDHRFGQLLTRAGRRIQLSAHVLTLDSDPLDMPAMLRHQHRIAVTYRCAAPLGALGLPVLHAYPLLAPAVLSSIFPHVREQFSFNMSIVLASAAIAVVWFGAMAAIVRSLRVARELALLAAFSAFIESACWLVAWFSRSVFWAGKWRRVSWRGRLM